MNKPDAHSFDFLTGREADYMETVMDELKAVPWAKPLVNDINANGGLKGENKSKLFELRFGYEMHKAGITPRYEVAGEGESTLDFGFTSGDRDFLIEMVRLEETNAVKAATTTEEVADGVTMVKRSLSSTAADSRQSPEGETLMAVQRICQKLENNGKPHKFPPPASATHVLLVDVRTLFNGGDEWDRIHVGLGGEFVPPQFRHFYKGNLITGVFGPKTNLKGAAEARERLHFIGFVNERYYKTGAFGPSIQFVGNPHLFMTAEAAQAALASWPLGAPDILNARPAKTSEDLRKLAEAISNLTVSESTELAKLLKEKWQPT